jgi:hypothetical protein
MSFLLFAATTNGQWMPGLGTRVAAVEQDDVFDDDARRQHGLVRTPRATAQC